MAKLKSGARQCPLMTVGCIDSECGHDAHHQQVMPTDDSALIVVEGMRPTCTSSDRAGWPVASAPVRGGGEFALPPAFATAPRCLLVRVLEEGREMGHRTRMGRSRAKKRALQVLTSWQILRLAQAPP